MTAHDARDIALTLLVGGAGAGLASLVGAPAAMLTGPALFVTLACLAGMRGLIPTPLRDACFLGLGIGIGATVTPDVIATAITWPLSLAVLTLSLLTILTLARLLLERMFAFDPMTALLSSVPGHLSYVMGLSSDLKSDLRRVALVQTMRVLLLTLLVPAILVASGFEGGVQTTAYGVLPPLPLALVALASLATGFVFKWLNIPAAFLLAGMVMSGALHGTALVTGAPPVWITTFAFVTMGALIGTRFNGITLQELKDGALAGIGTTLIACAIASIGALITARILDLPAAMLLIAFAPGGVEIMAAMAVQIGVEPAFVAAHHVLRLLILTVLVPILLARLRRRL
ncbi:AbrB family transcriptional regulator [Gymnodinialimonas sp. 2305UL16-5]|uniref:AbrB family transcriptional regulator n=1 Tax=Gymnodinialimonas mytili TaxID=3126503 RepID=UPI00309679C7